MQSWALAPGDGSVSTLYSLRDFEPPTARYHTSTPARAYSRHLKAAVAIADYPKSDESELALVAGDVVR